MPRIPLADLERAVAEQAALRGARVRNVYQCGPRLFLLRLEHPDAALVLDLRPGLARALVTDDPPPVPERPPAFGAILRKALRGGRLLGSVLPQRDRVVYLDFDAGRTLRLVVEAIGRHPNLLLLDGEGRVERVLDGEAARHRGTPVGSAYALPRPPSIPEEDTLLGDGLAQHPFAVNHALDRIVRAEAERDRGEREARERERAIERLRRMRRAVERDLRELADPDRLRRQGEVLLADYGHLRQGQKNHRGVALDPRLSPQENVERIFERARKAERARPALEARLAAIDEWIRRAEAGEPIKGQPPSRKGRPPEPRRPYRVFVSAEGRRILVGKGGRDNDRTTLEVAGPHDLFLHVRGSPGAHVIVPLRRDEEPGEQTLLDAATLALHYSKQRTAAAADVSWTRCKFVRKPPGAKPGLVQVQREKVFRLRREPERLARLLMTAGGGAE